MDALATFLSDLTPWHWLGLGILLLSIEVLVGTFDLLWVALAAFVTALFAWLAPAGLSPWQGELVCFAATAVLFVLAGRTLFSGLRRAPASHPNLNDRMGAMTGQRGVAAGPFEQGQGRVRIGDTVWSAVQDGEAQIANGDDVVVTGANGAVLRVRRG